MSLTTVQTQKVHTPQIGCMVSPEIFQHPLVEDSPSELNKAEQKLQNMLLERADSLCAQCPMFNQCLYDSVVKHNVSGFVAGTTEKQRAKIRRKLGVKVAPENLDVFVGAHTKNHSVDHEELMKIRALNPDDTLIMLAERVGCSLSTVKRHIKRGEKTNPSKTKPSPVPPSKELVLQAFAEVCDKLPESTQIAA